MSYEEMYEFLQHQVQNSTYLNTDHYAADEATKFGMMLELYGKNLIQGLNPMDDICFKYFSNVISAQEALFKINKLNKLKAFW